MSRKWKWAGVALSLTAVLGIISNLALASTGPPDEIRDAYVTGAVLAAGLAVAGALFAIVVHLSADGKSEEKARITAVEMFPLILIATSPLAIANGIAWWDSTENVTAIGWGVIQMALGAILLRRPQYLTILGGTTESLSQRTSYAVATHPRALTLAMTSATLAPLILGIISTTLGMALLYVDLELARIAASALLIIGVIGLVTSSIAARRVLSDPHLLESSTALALYVAVEFLAGALLAYVGIANIVFDFEDLPWALAAIAVFGLLLVTDSLLLYRRGFRRGVGKKKGV